MTASSVRLSLGVLFVTALGFFFFPGHTILQSDTQIYIPMLERLADPSVLARDLIAVRPHMAFTLYDEMLLVLRRTSGLSFETLLVSLQFIVRALGVVGIVLFCTSLGLDAVSALVVASLLSLGAAVMGPAVLTVEYEPVPRGFALPFVWLSLGCIAHRRWRPAVIAATTGFAFHPPTVLGYCVLLFIALCFQKRYRDIAFLLTGPAILLLTIWVEPPSPERSTLFSTIDPALEQLQRMRASYNWVSLWFAEWAGHYALLLAVFTAAFWRVGHRLTPLTRGFVLALPVMGVLSLAVSALLLERWKWILGPQIQPGRYLLFVTFFTVLLSAIAALQAAQAKRWVEAVLFAFIAVAVPLEDNLLHLLWPNSALLYRRLVVSLAGAGLLAVSFRWRPAALALSAAFFVVLPPLGSVTKYAPLHSAELDQLSAWARSNTSKDALFQFANFGRRLEPGIFRARALRALYVDWKSGGQVNFMKPFSIVWWERWQQVNRPQSLEGYRLLGVDYVVYSSATAPKNRTPTFSNKQYVVYKLR